MRITIILILYFFIIIFNFLPVIKEKQKKEIWIYSAFLFVSFIVLVLNNFSVKLPSPTNMISDFIGSVFHTK